MTPASVTISARPDGVHPPRWHHHAACRGAAIGLFHGTIGQLRHDQALCRRCPVADACLWAAMLEGTA